MLVDDLGRQPVISVNTWERTIKCTWEKGVECTWMHRPTEWRVAEVLKSFNISQLESYLPGGQTVTLPVPTPEAATGSHDISWS
jgi:hypothetical protein